MQVVILFYEFVIKSKTEFLFIKRNNQGEILGTCVVSIDPIKFSKRFLKSHMNKIIYFGIKNLGILGFLGLFICKICKLNNVSVTSLKKLPELTHIFIDSSFFGQGIGTSLLKNIEKYLTELGYKKYFTRTTNNKNNKAIKFYYKHQFEDFKGINKNFEKLILIKKIN